MKPRWPDVFYIVDDELNDFVWSGLRTRQDRFRGLSVSSRIRCVTQFWVQICEWLLLGWRSKMEASYCTFPPTCVCLMIVDSFTQTHRMSGFLDDGISYLTSGWSGPGAEAADFRPSLLTLTCLCVCRKKSSRCMRSTVRTNPALKSSGDSVETASSSR